MTKHQNRVVRKTLDAYSSFDLAKCFGVRHSEFIIPARFHQIFEFKGPCHAV